jgi:hypothetical protein
MHLRILPATFVAVCAVAPFPAVAEGGPDSSGPRVGIHLGVEEFRWSESDSNGDKLLDEKGPRYSAAFTLDNFLKQAEGPIYAVAARGYAGTVDYDGETNAGVEVKTEVNYQGGAAEARVGYRFLMPWADYSIDLLAGLGGEYWSRDIEDAYDANGNRARGYTEEYTVTYTKAGVGFADLTYREWYGRLETGMRYPMNVDERIDDLDADLSPDGSVSFYAAYEVSKATGFGQLGLTFYYEGYRFDESPVASSNIGLVRQPESKMDVFGIRFGVFL